MVLESFKKSSLYLRVLVSSFFLEYIFTGMEVQRKWLLFEVSWEYYLYTETGDETYSKAPETNSIYWVCIHSNHLRARRQVSNTA